MKSLTVEDALSIHTFQMERFGGESGVRSLDLLESAVAQAQASFGGEYLHRDGFEMAPQPAALMSRRSRSAANARHARTSRTVRSGKSSTICSAVMPDAR